MISGDNINPSLGGTPEKREADKERRLHSVGELINDTEKLIELLNAEHHADQIDYKLVFPILPYSSALLPDVLAIKNPDYITITAGKTKIKNDEGDPVGTSTHLSIDVAAGENELRVLRNSDDAEDIESSEDIIFNTAPRDEEGLSFVDKIIGESDEEFSQRMTSVAKIPRHEINSLLMSLAIPNNGDYSHFGDKNLLDLETFTFLIEALRSNAFDADVRGIYLFQVNEAKYWGDAELKFEKINGDESFTIAFTNAETDQTLLATANTKTGFDLKFYSYESGTSTGLSPTTDEIVFLQRVIHNELHSILKTIETSDGCAIVEPGDPENIAIGIVTAEDEISYMRLHREIEQALGEDGFDSTDPSAT